MVGGCTRSDGFVLLLSDVESGRWDEGVMKRGGSHTQLGYYYSSEVKYCLSRGVYQVWKSWRGIEKL